MDSNTVFLMVQSDIDLLAVCVDENNIEKNQKEYRHLLAKIGPKAFKRPPLAHRNGITTE